MNKPFKLSMGLIVLASIITVLMFGQSQASAALNRKTSALKQADRASVSTKRVALTPTHQLHVVVTAYDKNQNISHHKYSYKLFRNGKSVRTISFSNGHTTRAIKAKPGNYSVRVYSHHKNINFSGGVSTSDQPHFV
ncbi:hypothetical protein [Secundilactobacillus silagei]|mgnify:FL=1|uniref:Uncharacterized protein n=1 Tax=Secundilactobacillus silagei JCM 19001 TaxID=1302250 RepID=A0A1Z5IJ25_9LACO|nr:hypothetical protein [Secundilactobacillus silagei]TDG71019.1 hypothetical protein C5L25_001207 [Secundilactobacillus silagei JCM 19001]GAX01689.1 hypothetical protein IWT126_01732 [Secundilactobacillus silagei JCM 19001]